MFTIVDFFPQNYNPKPEELENSLIWVARNNLVWRIYEIETGNKCEYKITSGFRTPEHNITIGGAKNSYHCKGMAGDILDDANQLKGKWITSKPPKFLNEMQLSVESIQYTKGKWTNWVHTDIAQRNRQYKVFVP